MLSVSAAARRCCLFCCSLLLIGFVADEGKASRLVLSTLTSESGLEYMGTPVVELLDATVDLEIVDMLDPACNNTDCLKITLTNDTNKNFPTFLADINELGWSGSESVTSISPDTLPAGWSFHPSTGNGGPTDFDGFGVHDYSVTSSVSKSLGPGLTLVFSFAVNPGLAADDFVVFSAPKGEGGATTAAAKFVRFRDGLDLELDLIDLCDDGDPQTPACDSSLGAVPEPATAVLFGLGLLGLGIAGRRTRL